MTEYSCRFCTYSGRVEVVVREHVAYHHSDMVDEAEDGVEVVADG